MKNKELITQKVDKENAVVLINGSNYIFKMKSILKDTFKFQKIKIDESKVLNYLISIENVVISLLKILKGKNEIGRKTYITLHPVGFEP